MSRIRANLLALVAARLDLLEDFGARLRFGVEDPLHDRVELVKALEGGEVEIRKTIGREDDLAMLVDFIGMLCRSPFR
jgi:hypothetical protein